MHIYTSWSGDITRGVVLVKILQVPKFQMFAVPKNGIWEKKL